MEQIINMIKKSKTFLIISHINPDGDTIGSNIGLSLSLKSIGKDVISYCDSKIPFEYQFLLSNDFKMLTIPENIMKSKFDVMIMLDCADSKRTKHYQEFRNISEILINIDHHKSNDKFGDLNIIYEDYSSTGEIVYDILINGGFPVNRSIAEAIYTAIITDTGSFRYSNTNSRTFDIASDLIKYGVNSWEISQKIYENKPYKRIMLLKEALNSLKLNTKGKIAVLSISKNILDVYNATGEDTDGLVNYGRSIEGVEVSIFIREEENGCKLSFRSKGKVDVSSLARTFDGGGHRNAAGGFINKPLFEVEKLIMNIAEEYVF